MARGGHEACLADDTELATGLVQALLHGFPKELLVCLRLHKFERVVHRLVLVELLVCHLVVVKFLFVEPNDSFDVLDLKIDLVLPKLTTRLVLVSLEHLIYHLQIIFNQD